jgi:hypothetical protein
MRRAVAPAMVGCRIAGAITAERQVPVEGLMIQPPEQGNHLYLGHGPRLGGASAL